MRRKTITATSLSSLGLRGISDPYWLNPNSFSETRKIGFSVCATGCNTSVDVKNCNPSIPSTNIPPTQLSANKLKPEHWGLNKQRKTPTLYYKESNLLFWGELIFSFCCIGSLLWYEPLLHSSATTATQNCRLLALPRNSLFSLFEQNKELHGIPGLNVARETSRHLRDWREYFIG